MAKKAATSEFICSNCARRESKWLGRCPECGEWNTFKEVATQNSKPSFRRANEREAQSIPLSSIKADEGQRIASGLSELDRVLGGGIIKGGCVLLGGEPGIGKSTLLLQVACLAKVPGRVLYISGEESAIQIKLRAERLGLSRDGLELYCGSNLQSILVALEETKPSLIVVDSIQTLYHGEIGAVPGTANQMKYCVMEICDWAKPRGIPALFIAHVTKEGTISGPKAIEHLVDTVCYFEQADGQLRLIRPTKNRFGATDELGLFHMTEVGLKEIGDASELFLVKRDGPLPYGVCVSPIYEGSRVLLVEIQALTVPAKTGISRVYSDKIETQRVARVAAVLEKHVKVCLQDQDIYVNVAGGIRISEESIDLALACALYSARIGQALSSNTAVYGEISLAAEVRSVPQIKKRNKACRGLGYTNIICPAYTADIDDSKTIKVNNVGQALTQIFKEATS